MANFVSPPIAAGLGGGASALALYGETWWQRRQERAHADTAWESAVLAGPAAIAGSRFAAHAGSVLYALNPDQRVVPFSPLRRPDLLSIVDWCLGPSEKRLWQVTGGAGSGKTRLLIEAVQQLAGKNFECGWVRHGQAATAAEAAITRPGRVLLVIDDVDASPRQQDDLTGMLSTLARAPAGQVKVVLSGREFASWWARVRAAMDPADQAVLAPAGRTTLTRALASPADQLQQFQGAARRYARHFDRPVPAAALTGTTTAISVAELHAAAAITAYNGLTGPVDLTTALHQLFTTEETWWLTNAAEQQPAIRLPLPVVQGAITAATLVGADSMDQAVRRLAHLPGLTISSHERRTELALWLHQLYAQRGGQWLDLHLPAYLADRYAALIVTAQPGLPAALAAAALTT
ncbi:hypothetical protein AB0C98_42015 [Streptomyces sp. NPDC048558]|uniref:P-loop NTPase n=1 Tax=Streptomyces sp. NPDC048558 TaxID=3155759 RepID=UPI003446F919